ncbi:hypothetical protein QUF99_16215 [Bacillus sp. DX4.1]|uniref:hypothetical protein n=1 Tax=Bacillus sp. DX4.1 TaxID=3055867 RepID=UPI0025A2B7BF|nr:hypothetical protein [Bacillus sp. DX4.1]MDM5188804.1 hypothetical protein [Bacillus sp. DX4.1]
MQWKNEEIIFESVREAEVWADSISNEIYGRSIDGYSTPDYKIAYALTFMLATVPFFRVHTKKYFLGNAEMYKVWVTDLRPINEKNM